MNDKRQCYSNLKLWPCGVKTKEIKWNISHKILIVDNVSSHKNTCDNITSPLLLRML